MSDKETKLEILEKLKRFVINTEYYFPDTSFVVSVINEIEEQIAYTETLRLKRLFPLNYEVPKFEKDIILKGEFAHKFAEYLVENDLIILEHKGADKKSMTEIYETELTFCKGGNRK